MQVCGVARHASRGALDAGDVKGVAAGDLDNDGAAEIVLTCEKATGDRSGVFYVRREPGEAWSERSCDTAVDVAGLAGSKFDLVQLTDVDDDGWLDVVTSEEEDGLGVVWYRNPGSY